MEYFFGRMIKIFANIVKIISYAFHFFFPKYRFSLPSYSAPIFKYSKSSRKISKIIWQTNYTNKVSLPVYFNYLCNRLLAPTFEYRYVDSEGIADFIKENFPANIYKQYSRLQIGAAQADYWRVLSLFVYGGVYLDIDAHLIWPLELILKPEDSELYIERKRGGVSNYFFASEKNNSNLKIIADEIYKNIEENAIKSVYELTGPGVFNECLPKDVHTKIYYKICYQGSFTNEYFQYIDKKEGKWHRVQKIRSIIKD